MNIEEDSAQINVLVGEASKIAVGVQPSQKIDVIVGDAAKMDCTRAINYIKSGTAEIDKAVEEGIEDFNANAVAKTNAFNTNATNKTNAFDLNASNKTQDFNDNATSKTGDFNSNATDKTNTFNQNATDKTGDFNDNATDKTNDFNSNASDKTQDFNDNYVAKKQIIDDAVSDAQGYATSASNSADLAKQWAIGDPSEPVGYSSKYWANEASSTVSNMANKDLSNLSATGDAKFVQPSQLATVATTGDYDDLINKPTIPAAQVNSDWNALSGVAQILNKPTIPTVNNSTIEFTQGGVSKGSFTLNQATGATIALDSGGSIINTDGVTINTNADDELQAIGVIEKNAGNVKYDWVGTSAEYTAQNVATLHPDWVCFITDDEIPSNFANTDISNLTTTGKSTVAELPMPSDNYVDLSVPSDGTQYTAPANGWLVLKGTINAQVGLVGFEYYPSGIATYNWASLSGNDVASYIPVSKGQTVALRRVNISSLSTARFYYAKGEI